jgi:hypothetical protein
MAGKQTFVPRLLEKRYIALTLQIPLYSKASFA